MFYATFKFFSTDEIFKVLKYHTPHFNSKKSQQIYTTLYCICFCSGKKCLCQKVVIFFSKLEYLIHHLNGDIILCHKKISCRALIISEKRREEKDFSSDYSNERFWCQKTIPNLLTFLGTSINMLSKTDFTISSKFPVILKFRKFNCPGKPASRLPISQMGKMQLWKLNCLSRNVMRSLSHWLFNDQISEWPIFAQKCLNS